MFLEIEHLRKSFEDLVAVNDLNIGVEKGELLCLLGPSGCGKTTTLKMIGGFLIPDEGKIWIDGQDVSKMPPDKRPVSTVFQSYALFPHMTVLENVIYGLKFQRIKRKKAKTKGEEYLELVGLSTYKNKRIHQLSGGQQQRVALARSLIVNPKVLLLDEPLSNLDAKLRIKMREEIKNIQRKFGITMVFVTHDQEEALTMGDKIGIMNEGMLEQLGTAREIYENPKTPFVLDFIGNSNTIKDENGNISFVRPEMIDITDYNGDVKGKIIGKIEEKIFLGPYIKYKINVENNIIEAQVTNKSTKEYQIGDKVYLEYKTKQM
ncbi:ABC transporter ATP-binding protein [Clostridiisalibacter paucivorans]|uniref:ABC transporter ATP-binding protein n=1 Tax=Clostridiisalibacter paucivorans TaxID=408753 RepID=UPI00047A7C8B|nr:ABC transporter ATP-binding protein [Clostridiisalibacter paucivorans]